MVLVQINAVYGYGSTGVIVQEIHKMAQQQGWESYVAFPKGKGQSDSYAIEIGSYVDHKMHAALSRLQGKQAYFSHCATSKFLSQLDSLKPDIVHLHNLHSNYIHLNSLLSYLAKNQIRVVVTMHDCWYFTGGCFHYTSVGCDKWKTDCKACPKRLQDTPAYLGKASSSILKDRLKYFSMIPNLTFVGCSNWVVDEIKKSRLSNVGKVLTIPNGFDLSIFRPLDQDSVQVKRQKLGVAGKKVILGPANKWLDPINRSTFDYFCEHLPADYVLLLFGMSAQNSQPLPHNVLCCGFVSDKAEMASLYSIADVMVNCSREDTLSSLNLEAQACGTPVVTYDATGSKETVDGVCGFSIETGNYKSLFDYAIKVCEEGKTSYSASSVQWVKEHFEKSINYMKYIELYHSVLDKK